MSEFRSTYLGLLFVVGWFGLAGGLRGQTAPAVQATPTEAVLSNFQEIWQLPPAQQQRWHQVRLEYVVYYYDPQWRAMWGQCGDQYGYLSLGSKLFPIKPGQRILVEGRMRPASGMVVEDPKVTIEDQTVKLEPLSTKGDVGNTERFTKRLVTMEGYVDWQSLRDANHLDFTLIAEGHSVFGQLLLKNDRTVPQLRERFVRVRGVYFARVESGNPAPKIEVWVADPEDIAVAGSIDRDPRFDLPVTPIAGLAALPATRLARISGAVVSRDEGNSVTIRDDSGTVRLLTPQTAPLRTGDQVEAIGFPGREGRDLVLKSGLFRSAQSVITSGRQLWTLPEAERLKRHPVRIDYLLYYFDPLWKVAWGRADGSDDYLSFGRQAVTLKPGDRVRIEGSIRPSDGAEITDAKVTVLAEHQPLQPIEVRSGIGDTDRLNKHLAIVEGYVDRQFASDVNHLELDLVIEGRPVILRVLVGNDETVPLWEGALLRAKGVYSATNDPAGGPPTIEVWTQSIRDVKKIGELAEDKRLSLPVTTIEQLPTVAADTPVHLAGAVQAQQPGKSLTIRDETGQLRVPTAQHRAVTLGAHVEVVGYASRQKGEPTLREALYWQSDKESAGADGGVRLLRIAEQVRQLSVDEAARSFPVRLAGTVTWTNPAADFCYVRDASSGVCVYCTLADAKVLRVGARVEIEGKTAAGRFTPVVMATNIQVTASVDLPEAKAITLEQALTGVEEAQWVSMTGYVRDVVTEGLWKRLELTTSAGDFTATMAAGAALPDVKGAVVRLRGVCSALTNAKRQLTGVQLWVPSGQFVEVEEARPADPFTVPLRPIAGLRQFGSLRDLNRRVRVSGVVIHYEPGRLVNIQDGSEGLLVLSRVTTPLALGDRIEAVGFPGRLNRRVVLREAVYRRVATGAEPSPVEIRRLAPIDAELDGRLARVEGKLLDVAGYGSGAGLIVQNGSTVFEARVGLARDAAVALWAPGSEIALTGVYEIEFDEYRRPYDVFLQLRSAGDVAVLARPPWWTARQILALTGILAVAAALGFGWVVALRRRVKEQTDVIDEQIEKEKAARLETALTRASKLESLGVLAGGIAHDFNNLLTVIIGNVSLARLDERLDSETASCLSETERAATRAKDLTQQLLTFAKGGEPVRAVARLPDIVREATEFGLHGTKTRSDFEIQADLWPANIDRGQIAQVVHNIVINATQAMPQGGLVRIAMCNEAVGADGRPGLQPGNYVKMSFSDTGRGISPENLSRIFEPYFTTKKQGSGLGLATVYSIVKRHHGHIEVASKEGEGTIFHVWLPAASEAPATPTLAEKPPGPRTSRVLLMDDEAAIRLVGSAVLKRLGFDVTAVNDGAAVVNEYAAARAAGRAYDLVILDLTVPGAMGGAEAMEILRTMDPAVRAIVSSGYSADPVMADFQKYGFRGRVPKPYAADELSEVVKAVMKDGTGGNAT